MAKVLVVGGAGYVGGATCAWLTDRGHEVWVIDDFSTGHTETVLAHRVLRARIGDRERVLPWLKEGRFDCVMHFAAKALVAESVRHPEAYFENNVEQLRALLQMMAETGPKRLVFSSTCAIFGDPGERGGAIDETLPQHPINPYGETKKQAECLLREFAASHGIQSIALRYFNAAGAEPGLRTGEWHEPESHLIPNIFRAVLNDSSVSVFGTDYPTRDGSCVRDYVHVTDLASAHEAAMLRLIARPDSGSFEAFNLGSETGYSVLEVIKTCEKILGKPIRTEVRERRPGDPPTLVARSNKARTELGFKTQDNSLERIISSAWSWENKMLAPKQAVFLDRDGTLNPDPGYISHPDQIAVFPGIPEALSLLRHHGYRLIVVSNQSGVGRGMIRREDIPRIHQRLDDFLGAHGTQIDHYELCFCVPEEPGCDCRKPGPKMIHDAASKLGIDISRSFMVGDKSVDIEAGWNAGVRSSILVRTGEGSKTEKLLSATPQSKAPSFIARDLLEAAQWIVSQPRD